MASYTHTHTHLQWCERGSSYTVGYTCVHTKRSVKSRGEATLQKHKVPTNRRRKDINITTHTKHTLRIRHREGTGRSQQTFTQLYTTHHHRHHHALWQLRAEARHSRPDVSLGWRFIIRGVVHERWCRLQEEPAQLAGSVRHQN